MMTLNEQLLNSSMLSDFMGTKDNKLLYPLLPTVYRYAGAIAKDWRIPGYEFDDLKQELAITAFNTIIKYLESSTSIDLDNYLFVTLKNKLINLHRTAFRLKRGNEIIPDQEYQHHEKRLGELSEDEKDEIFNIDNGMNSLDDQLEALCTVELLNNLFNYSSTLTKTIIHEMAVQGKTLLEVSNQTGETINKIFRIFNSFKKQAVKLVSNYEI